MKRFSLILISVLCAVMAFAQAPQSFKYQAVIRYSDGAIVQNQMVSLRISLLADSPQGTATYAETHDVTTNQFGIANIDIGEGTPQSGNFNSIAWGEHTYFIQTELDITGNDDYEFIGTSRLQSVPYALYAANAVNVDDEDADPTNELQIISLSNDTLYLSDGGDVYLGDYMDNTDEQDLSIVDNTLYISNGQSVDLTPYLDNTDEQEINLSGTDLSISNGNSISLDTLMDNTDEQQISFEGTELTITNGNTVLLDTLLDNTDEQNIELNGTTLSITNGNSVDLGGTVDLDADPTNELQVLSISNDTIFLTDGGFVKLPETFDGMYSSLVDTPVNVSHFNNDAGYITTETQTLADVASINDSVNSQIKNLHHPTDSMDAVNKAYVDMLIDVIENNNISFIDFNASETVVETNETIEFTNASAMSFTSLEWDFGDGNTSNDVNPDHVYISAGTYNVTLSLTNDFTSKSKTKTDYIKVLPAFTECGDVVGDIDGNTYETLLIGGQCWMTENLRVTHYPDGTEIPNITNDVAWDYLEDNPTADAYGYYANDSTTIDNYGLHYTWPAAMGDNAEPGTGIQGICPDGWHIPSDTEFKQLEIYLGMSETEADDSGLRGTNEGSKLAGNSSYWEAGDLIDDIDFGVSGFNAIAASNDLGGGNQSAHFWTSSCLGPDPWRRSLNSSYTRIYRSWSDMSSGYSIRCVKD